METDSAMDLTVRNNTSTTTVSSSTSPVPIVRPIPRPPWSILWYQNLWSLNGSGDRVTSEVGGGGGQGNEKPSVLSHPILNCIGSSTNANFSSFTSPFLSQHGGHQHHHHPLLRLPMSPDRYNTEVSAPPSFLQCGKGVTSDVLSKAQVDTRIFNRLVNTEDCERNSGCSSGEDNDENASESEHSARIVVTTTTSLRETPSNNNSNDTRSSVKSPLHPTPDDLEETSSSEHSHQTNVILDIACCDGPVQFKRISNPNFAVTVEHNDGGDGKSNTTTTTSTTATVMAMKRDTDAPRKYPSHHGGSSSSSTVTSLKTYLCIYCNQTFKSLFCYQKHKKRHLNPVSVDITTTTTNAAPANVSARPCVGRGDKTAGSSPVATTHHHGPAVSTSENTKAKTKDLNVQFFPCKKCGCKFPSYYFVHKHRKICH